MKKTLQVLLKGFITGKAVKPCAHPCCYWHVWGYALFKANETSVALGSTWSCSHIPVPLEAVSVSGNKAEENFSYSLINRPQISNLYLKSCWSVWEGFLPSVLCKT